MQPISPDEIRIRGLPLSCQMSKYVVNCTDKPLEVPPSPNTQGSARALMFAAPWFVFGICAAHFQQACASDMILLGGVQSKHELR